VLLETELATFRIDEGAIGSAGFVAAVNRFLRSMTRQLDRRR